MTGKELFYQLVDLGREGKNIGMSVGSPKLSTYMDGYLPGTNYLIGGASGVSKSTFTLFTFIYNPLKEYLQGINTDRDPYWILFNLEMTQPQIYAKLVSMYIFDTYGIELKFKEIFSRGSDAMLSDKHYEILKKCDNYLDILDKRLSCHDSTLNEEKYVKTLNEELRRFGTWKEGKYYPNNSNQIIGSLIDHVNLISASPGRTKKDEIDAISRNSVILRNSTGILSNIHVSQFNRNSNSDERLKQSLQDPTSADFKDSGSVYEDSNVVLALRSPHKSSLSSYKGYDVKQLEQVLIGTFLLKSRFGTSDIMVPMGFYGDCSTYLELPKPNEIYDYEKYKTPKWKNNKDDDKEVMEDTQKQEKPKFIL